MVEILFYRSLGAHSYYDSVERGGGGDGGVGVGVVSHKKQNIKMSISDTL